jgi:hypothetical protein
MDKNSVVLSGMLASVSQRPVGAQGRTLYEVRLDVTKPATRGREAEMMTVPVIVWAAELGLALEALAAGTPLTIVGRVSARSWTPAGGGTERVFVEIVAESMMVDVAAIGTPSEATPASGYRPGARQAWP